mmetsp:Transcript_17476/g.26196  ORF Transcript_17476/g.26196 Transcript_17476/m.26196 type:complete len:329 (-) Transcript_17476:1832-2818(-)
MSLKKRRISDFFAPKNGGSTLTPSPAIDRALSATSFDDYVQSLAMEDSKQVNVENAHSDNLKWLERIRPTKDSIKKWGGWVKPKRKNASYNPLQDRDGAYLPGFFPYAFATTYPGAGSESHLDKIRRAGWSGGWKGGLPSMRRQKIEFVSHTKRHQRVLVAVCKWGSSSPSCLSHFEVTLAKSILKLTPVQQMVMGTLSIVNGPYIRLSTLSASQTVAEELIKRGYIRMISLRGKRCSLLEIAKALPTLSVSSLEEASCGSSSKNNRLNLMKKILRSLQRVPQSSERWTKVVSALSGSVRLSEKTFFAYREAVPLLRYRRWLFTSGCF